MNDTPLSDAAARVADKWTPAFGRWVGIEQARNIERKTKPRCKTCKWRDGDGWCNNDKLHENTESLTARD